MPVVGCHAHILEYTAHMVNVHGFAEDLGNLQAIPVVHAIIAYDCPITAHTYLLSIHNAIYIESMTVNLIPPFMMRLAGMVVNECPEILVTIHVKRTIHFTSQTMNLDFPSSYIILYRIYQPSPTPG